MRINDRALRELLTESSDIHHDSMRSASASLGEFAAIGEQRRRDRDHRTAAPSDALARVARYDASRRSVIAGGGVASIAWLTRGLFAGGAGAALSALFTSPVRADTALDVQILQTAVSLELLAIATYNAALELPFIANGNPVVKSFAEITMMQHSEHAAAFNAQATALGGAEQTMPNPKYTPIVEAAKPTLEGPGDVVMLAIALETVATQTYVKNASLIEDPTTKLLVASVSGVEAQHLATLRAVAGLLLYGEPDLIAIPTDPSQLPAAAGSGSFPRPFEGTAMASPPQEGAVQ
jgi:rubrerythrin